jgi:hypothetical protein
MRQLRLMRPNFSLYPTFSLTHPNPTHRVSNCLVSLFGTFGPRVDFPTGVLFWV